MPIPIEALILGDSAVGKTTFINLMSSNKQEDTKSTAAPGVYPIDFQYQGDEYQLRLTDTPGQDQYRQVVKPLFRDKNILIFIISVDQLEDILENRPNDKDGISFYLAAAHEVINPTFLPFFVINKIDLLGNNEERLNKLKEALFQRLQGLALAPNSPEDIWTISCTAETNTDQLFAHIQDTSAQYYLDHPRPVATPIPTQNDGPDKKCCS